MPCENPKYGPLFRSDEEVEKALCDGCIRLVRLLWMSAQEHNPNTDFPSSTKCLVPRADVHLSSLSR